MAKVDLSVLTEKTPNEKWYTIEELAELCGFSTETLKHGEVNLKVVMEKMSINIEVNTRLGGYHNTQKFYSENVLKALKEYQIKNSVPNALRGKEVAIQGNVSFTLNETSEVLPKFKQGQTSKFTEEQATLIKSENKQQATELKSVLISEASDMKIRGENTVTNLEVMSIKDLAMTFGVSVRTIQKIIADKGYEIDFVPLQTKGGVQKVACVNNAVATAIKTELQNHSKIAQNGFNTMTITNDLEAWELQKRLDAYKDMRIAELQKENMQQKQQLAEQKPKVIAFDRIADGKGCFTVNQAAKALKLPYGNITLYKNLRAANVLNSDNSPKQEQINNGNFRVIVKFINGKVGNKPVTLITSKGLVYLAKKLNTTINETVKADA